MQQATARDFCISGAKLIPVAEEWGWKRVVCGRVSLIRSADVLAEIRNDLRGAG